MNYPGLHILKQRQDMQQQEKHLRDAYRAVFLNDLGREVLDDILRHCSYWSTIDPADEGQVALGNLGKLIMAKLGIVSDENTISILQALSGIAPTD